MLSLPGGGDICSSSRDGGRQDRLGRDVVNFETHVMAETMREENGNRIGETYLILCAVVQDAEFNETSHCDTACKTE